MSFRSNLHVRDEKLKRRAKPRLPSADLRPLRKLPRYSVIKQVTVEHNSRIYDQVNLYRCRIGKNTKIDAFVYIEENAVVGNNCKIRPFVFIPTGVTIEDNVFIAPNVTFTNDKYPRTQGTWRLLKTRVKKYASIGAGSVINPGITIGENALIGAGSTVTRDIPDNAVAHGNPARVVGHRKPPGLG
jgi:UDP-2-acetamido-3-amino-2,3-dideoxy-glucuronate N-acetyltransferase